MSQLLILFLLRKSNIPINYWWAWTTDLRVTSSPNISQSHWVRFEHKHGALNFSLVLDLCCLVSLIEKRAPILYSAVSRVYEQIKQELLENKWEFSLIKVRNNNEAWKTIGKCNNNKKDNTLKVEFLLLHTYRPTVK